MQIKLQRKLSILRGSTVQTTTAIFVSNCLLIVRFTCCPGSEEKYSYGIAIYMSTVFAKSKLIKLWILSTSVCVWPRVCRSLSKIWIPSVILYIYIARQWELTVETGSRNSRRAILYRSDTLYSLCILTLDEQNIGTRRYTQVHVWLDRMRQAAVSSKMES